MLLSGIKYLRRDLRTCIIAAHTIGHTTFSSACERALALLVYSLQYACAYALNCLKIDPGGQGRRQGKGSESKAARKLGDGQRSTGRARICSTGRQSHHFAQAVEELRGDSPSCGVPSVGGLCTWRY